MTGPSQSSEIHRLLNRVRQNMAFLNKDDIKILEHLATKGDFPNKKVVLVNNETLPKVDPNKIFKISEGI